jgi:hypothetical protein
MASLFVRHIECDRERAATTAVGDKLQFVASAGGNCHIRTFSGEGQ